MMPPTALNALKYSRCFLKAMAKRQHIPCLKLNALLPLDGCRWFGGDVVHYPVDPFDLVDDVVADLGEKSREMEPVGGHGVGGDNGAGEPQDSRRCVHHPSLPHS